MVYLAEGMAPGAHSGNSSLSPSLSLSVENATTGLGVEGENTKPDKYVLLDRGLGMRV